jgi:hypothetical protein
MLRRLTAEARRRPEKLMKTIHVESYAGYRADERPLRLRLEQEVLEIAEVEDRWYSPGETYFRIVVANGDHYVLRHLEAQDVWSIEGYRSHARRMDLTS